MSKVRLLVHLGPMKTGTSAFAAHLSRRASAGTLPSSLIYPTGDLWLSARGDIVKHHDLVELAPARLHVEGERRRTTEATPQILRERFAAIAAEAAARGGEVTVVMVCEIADQRATPQLGKVLREYFDTVDFVIVARDQTSAVRSLLGQQIRMWNRTDVASLDSGDFTRKHVERGSYDYARLWDKWNIGSKDYAVHFVPYRDGVGADDLSQDVFSAAGVGEFPHSPDLLNGARIHSTFSGGRMKELATIKRWGRLLAVVPGARALSRWAFDSVVRRAHAEISRKSVRARDAWTLSSTERSFIREQYRESNERFRSQLGAEGTNPRWTDWFSHTLGPMT